MLVLPNGVSKMGKECFISMLKDDSRTTVVFMNAKVEAKSYKQTEKIVLYSLIAFLKTAKHISGGFFPTVHFSQGDGFGSHSGLFPEFRLVGVPEASHFSSIDQVSFSLETIADSFCGNVYNAEVTRVFNSFVDFLCVVN